MTQAGISRRRFLRDAGIAAALATSGVPLDRALANGRSRGGKAPTVAIFGGGVAGLTAAHELIERGFTVTVYEARAWGGKARSTVISGSGEAGREPLPSELGLQVEFGAFRNLADTMRRIPFGSNPSGVYDNLVQMPELGLARKGKSNVVLPVGTRAASTYTPQQILDLVEAVAVELQLPPAAAAHFGNRLGVFLSSSDARRDGQWESTSWQDFIAADQYGPDYYAMLGRLAEFTQAVPADRCSARFVSWVFEWFIYSLLGQGADGAPLQTLAGPSNETWIEPWLALLDASGARLRLGHKLVEIDVRDGRITQARVGTRNGTRTVIADYYVVAIPVERARKLLTKQVLNADPQLAGMLELEVAAADGIQFYLREPVDLVTGVINSTDAPWALATMPQSPLWAGALLETRGDGEVREKLAIIIANWHAPGVVHGKPAVACTPDEIAQEVWEQLKQHSNKVGSAPLLTDDLVHSWAVSDEVVFRGGRAMSRDPLVLPTVGAERHQPRARTAIRNLVLAGDYVRGTWEVANLEAASFSGRTAANAVLAATGSRESPAAALPSYRPPEWEPLKAIDEQRYAKGEANLFDADMPAAERRALLGRLS